MKRKDNSTNGNAITPDDVITGGDFNESNEKQRREKERRERQGFVLWKRPLATVEYATREVGVLLTTYSKE